MVAANNAIYNTVGATISGVTNTLTVTNASNTASSAARETIVVGGGSAGDPTLNFNVSGVTNWEVGIDNSVNDNLTISQGTALGTNDTWRMNTSGQRTMPLQPAFFANLTLTTANNKTGDGTAYAVICDQVVFDQASSYNNGTGIFTAPINGKYLFTSSLTALNMNAAHTSIRYFFVNSGAIPNFQFAGTTGADQTIYTGNGSAIINLTAGQTVQIFANVGGGTKTVGIQGGVVTIVTWFSGFLLC